jgi:sporulation protein YlmC with PRC-barrel domain
VTAHQERPLRLMSRLQPKEEGNCMNRPAIFLIATLLASSIAHGQEQTSEAVPQNDLATTDLVGKKVRDVEGNHVGRVTDLVVDQDSRVEAVLVHIGGFLGIGARPVLIEASSIRTDESDAVRIGLTGPQLDTLPPAP